MTDAVTCARCGLKFFKSIGSACPRCTGAASSVSGGSAPPSLPEAASDQHAGVPVEVIDEARSRLLVWNDEPREVIERLARKGIPYDVAESVVSALAKEIRAKLAPHARFSGVMYLVIGVPMALFGAGMLYVYFRARSESDWRPVRFFGAMMVGGAVLITLGIAMTFTGLVRLMSGSPPPA